MGKSIVYDTVNGKEWKWSVDVRNHRINVLIDSVLSKNVSVPEALAEDDCVVGPQAVQASHLATLLIYLSRIRSAISGITEIFSIAQGRWAAYLSKR